MTIFAFACRINLLKELREGLLDDDKPRCPHGDAICSSPERCRHGDDNFQCLGGDYDAIVQGIQSHP